MGLLESIQEMKDKAQADVDKFAQLEDLAKQATQAPAVGEDFKAELDKAKGDLDKYKSIVKAHIADEKTETDKLEKDLGDLDPVIPQSPKEGSASGSADSTTAQPQAPAASQDSSGVASAVLDKPDDQPQAKASPDSAPIVAPGDAVKPDDVTKLPGT